MLLFFHMIFKTYMFQNHTCCPCCDFLYLDFSFKTDLHVYPNVFKCEKLLNTLGIQLFIPSLHPLSLLVILTSNIWWRIIIYVISLALLTSSLIFSTRIDSRLNTYGISQKYVNLNKQSFAYTNISLENAVLDSSVILT